MPSTILDGHIHVVLDNFCQLVYHPIEWDFDGFFNTADEDLIVAVRRYSLLRIPDGLRQVKLIVLFELFCITMM